MAIACCVAIACRAASIAVVFPDMSRPGIVIGISRPGDIIGISRPGEVAGASDTRPGKVVGIPRLGEFIDASRLGGEISCISKLGEVMGPPGLGDIAGISKLGEVMGASRPAENVGISKLGEVIGAPKLDISRLGEGIGAPRLGDIAGIPKLEMSKLGVSRLSPEGDNKPPPNSRKGVSRPVPETGGRLRAPPWSGPRGEATSTTTGCPKISCGECCRATCNEAGSANDTKQIPL